LFVTLGSWGASTCWYQRRGNGHRHACTGSSVPGRLVAHRPPRVLDGGLQAIKTHSTTKYGLLE
jgi:hypothetical protein